MSAIEWALQAGFNIVCATCEHLHEALSSDKPHCGKTECGGPVYNKTFPLYNGIIPRESFPELCLVCGTNDISYFIIIDSNKAFGLCLSHWKGVDEAIEKLEVGDSPAAAILSRPTIVRIPEQFNV